MKSMNLEQKILLKKIVLIASVAFSLLRPEFAFAQPPLMAEAKPFRSYANGDIGFIKGKRFSMGFVRLFSDSRPIIGVTPVTTFPDHEFEPEFYDCLKNQVQEIYTAVKSNPGLKEKMPLNITIGVRQIELPFIESLCQPAVYLNSVNTVLMTICFSGVSSMQKGLVCKVTKNEDFQKSILSLANSPQKLKTSFDELKNMTKQLDQIMN